MQHVRDMPDPEVRITFPDGTYYKVIVSQAEAALIMAQTAKTVGVEPWVFNNENERLGVGTDNLDR